MLKITSSSSYDIAPKPPPPKYADFSGYGWIIVFCGFLLYLIVDGIAYNLGLINSAWLAEFKQSETATSWIGSIFYAVPLLSAPITAQLVEHFGCRMVTIVCGIISTAGFVISSICESIEQLYIAVGLIAGFGVSAAYIVGILSAERWFEKHRTLAIGIVSSGTGFGTFVIAPITQRLLVAFGWRDTMYFLASLNVLMSIVGCFINDPHWIITEMEEKGRRNKIIKNTEMEVNGISWNETKNDENSTQISINPRGEVDNYTKSYQNCENSKNIASNPENHTNSHENHSNPHRNDTNSIENHSIPNENHANVTQYQAISQNSSATPQISIISVPNNLTVHATTPLSPKSKKSSSSIFLMIPKLLKEKLKIVKKIFSHFSNRNFTLLAISTFAIYALYNVPMFFIIELLKGYGYNEEQCANYLSLIGISLLVGMVTLGYIGDISGDQVKNVNAACVLICGVAEILLPICAVHPTAFGACCVVFGFSFASAYVLIPKIAEMIVGVEEFATAIGLNFFVQGLALLFGIPFASVIYEYTGSWKIAFHICGTIIASGSIFAYLTQVKKDENNNE